MKGRAVIDRAYKRGTVRCRSSSKTSFGHSWSVGYWPMGLSVFAATPADIVVSSPFPAAAAARSASPIGRSPKNWCPSCGGRRMAETAAHLVDHVIPVVPVRQWVLSVPFALRYRLAYDSRLLSDVLNVFLRVVFGQLRRRARRHDFIAQRRKAESRSSWPYRHPRRKFKYTLRRNQADSISCFVLKEYCRIRCLET